MGKDKPNNSNQRPASKPKGKPIPSKQPRREVFNTPERRSVDRNTSFEIKPPPGK